MIGRDFIGMCMKTTICLSLAVALPAAAVAAGNGHGKGGINGGNNGKSAHSSSASLQGQGQGLGNLKNSIDIAARDLGSLNGFFNASPVALAKTSPKSAIGKVSIIYAGLLSDYLAGGTTTPADLAAALADAANKPLTAEIIEAVNARLAEVDPALQTSLASSLIAPVALAGMIEEEYLLLAASN